MSFVFTRLQGALKHVIINKAVSVRCITRGTVFRKKETGEESENSEEKPVDPAKDRRNPCSVETSIQYLASDAFRETYGNVPVWKLYRRNHKGAIPPEKTRKSCIRHGIITTGNPCPICRDEYLILDHRNTALLKQFISEINGEVLDYSKTCLCQKQHQNLHVAIRRAKKYGLITFDSPMRKYNYSDWYRPEEKAL